MNKTDTIKKLIECYLEIVNSPRNLSCKKLWKETRSIILDKWRGCPTIGCTPVVAWLGTDIIHPLFEMDMERYYREPLYFLEKWLQVKLFYYQNFYDDNYYDNFIPIWLGEGFEATLYGMSMRYAKDKDPSIERNMAPINEETILTDLMPIDFYSSGLMPLAIRFYEEISELVAPYGVEVGFVNWGNGPQMTCNYLYGFENMSVGYLCNPKFVHNLLLWIADQRIEWMKARSKYLGLSNVGACEILDDDLSVPNVSPRIYDEFIFPAEKKLADYHGTISYWHNCGPADPYLEKVHELGEIQLMHSGPFSDHKKIAEIFGPFSAIEHHVKPQEEGINADSTFLERRFREIHDMYLANHAKCYTLRITAYHYPGKTISEEIDNLKQWIFLAKKNVVTGTSSGL